MGTGTALATLRHSARQVIAPGLAVALGVGFVTVAIVLGASMRAGVLGALTGDLQRYAAVAVPVDQRFTDHTVERLSGLDGVGEVRTVSNTFVQLGSGYAVAQEPPQAGDPARLTDGRVPERADEVAISETTAEATGAGIGDTLTISGLRPKEPDHEVTVVGLVDTSDDVTAAGSDMLFATPAALRAWSPGPVSYPQLRVMPADGADPAAVLAAVRDELGAGAIVRSGTDQAEVDLEDQFAGGTEMLTGFLLGFAAIALFVAALVIANTLTILFARQARETALLRCLGATRSQVIATSLAQALLLGIVFSGVGVLAGLGISALLIAVATHFLDTVLPPMAFAVQPVWLLVPTVAGIAVMMLAALRPAWVAGRVAPLAALRPEPDMTLRSRAGLVRLGLGGLLIIGGFTLVGLAATRGGLWIGIAGGCISFTGILLASILIMPRLVALFGLAPAATGGVPGELAVDNTLRNPRRVATTTAALLVGVTLVVTTMVGAATARESIAAEMDSTFAYDLSLTAGESGFPAGAEDRFAAADGVQASAMLLQGRLQVDGRATPVTGVPDNAADVLRDATAARAVEPGVLLVGSADLGLRNGDEVTVSGDKGERVLRVVRNDKLGVLAMAADDLSALTRTHPEMLLLRLDDDRISDGVTAVRRVAQEYPELVLGGSAEEREQLNGALTVMLAIVTALLGVAVLIAVVGIANTLSLSVIERRRENALLRALGTTRGQLRGMLAIEGVLLAVVGALLGIALGIGYGTAGAATLLSEADLQVHPAIPWLSLAIVAVGAVAAGLVASVVPAVRAAKVPPAAALALD